MKLFLAYFFLLIAVGCHKNSPRKNDRESPSVQITTPSNNSIVAPNRPLTIAGTATDNQYIAEIHLHITNLTSGQLILDVHLYPASVQATFNQDFTPREGQRYRIQVIARDRSVNEGSQTIEISA